VTDFGAQVRAAPSKKLEAGLAAFLAAAAQEDK